MQLVTALHQMTLAEFQSLVSPAQQRALLARYAELSESSRIAALQRVKDMLDLTVEDLVNTREAGLVPRPRGGRGFAGRARSADARDDVDERIRDHTSTLQELAAEVQEVEQRYVQRARPAPAPAAPARPYLSQLFAREMDKARGGGRGGSAAGSPRSPGPDAGST